MGKVPSPIWIVLFAAACLCSGCAGPRYALQIVPRENPSSSTTQTDKSQHAAIDNRTGSTVVGGIVPAQALQPIVTETPPLPGVQVSIPPPVPVTVAALSGVTNFGTASPNIRPVESSTPAVVIAPPTLPVLIGPTVGSSNVRAMPTALGAALNLGPNENPLDRMLDLTHQIDARDTENKILLARIKTLEAAALSREQSLNEGIREVETATAEVIRARNDILAVRKEIVAIKAKMSLAEKEELETLKLIVDALEKLLQSEGKK